MSVFGADNRALTIGGMYVGERSRRKVKGAP